MSNTDLTTIVRLAISESWLGEDEEPGNCGEEPLYCAQCSSDIVLQVMRETGLSFSEVYPTFEADQDWYHNAEEMARLVARGLEEELERAKWAARWA